MLFPVIFLLFMLIFYTDTGKSFVVICAVIWIFGLVWLEFINTSEKVEIVLLLFEKGDKTNVYLV